MAAFSSRALSGSLLALTVVATWGAGCGGGGGGGYRDAVASSGGASAPDGGGTGTGGTGTGGDGTGGVIGTGGAVATGGSTPGAPVAIADFGTAIIAAQCTFFSRCGFYADAASCLATTWVGAEVLTLQADVAAGRVTYDAAQAGACADSIRNMPCTTSALVAQNAQPSPCENVTTGTVAPGGTCYIGDECAGSAECFSLSCTMACCAGTCVAPVANGADCAAAPCMTGSYCRQTGATTFRCTPRATAEGAVCDDGDGCAAPLFCIADANTSTTGTGSCGRTLPATGAACVQNAGCDDARDYCNTSNVCAKWVGIGQPCTAGSATTVDNCVWYAYCVAGVCKALGAPDAVCATFADGGDDCLGGQACPASMRCTAPPAATSCR